MITLTLLFNCYSLKNKGGRLWTKIVTSQSLQVHQVVKVVYCLRVLHSCLHVVLILVFEPWTLLNYTQRTRKLVTIKRKEEHRSGSI